MQSFGANLFLWAALAATLSWSAFTFAIGDDVYKAAGKTEEKNVGEKKEPEKKDEPMKEEPKPGESKKEEPKQEEPKPEEDKLEPGYHVGDILRPRLFTVVPATAST